MVLRPALGGMLTLRKGWWQNLPASSCTRQPGVSVPPREPTAQPAPCLGQVSGTLDLEKSKHLGSSKVGGTTTRWQQEKRNGCKGAKDFFASCKKLHGARFAVGKQATWCRTWKSGVGENTEEQGCMQERKRETQVWVNKKQEKGKYEE